jgi:hypothetical protein
VPVMDFMCVSFLPVHTPACCMRVCTS